MRQPGQGKKSKLRVPEVRINTRIGAKHRRDAASLPASIRFERWAS